MLTLLFVWFAGAAAFNLLVARFLRVTERRS